MLVLMLMSGLLVGFVALINADQVASGINRDQTQAYAAAHAGIEKLTADLGQVFWAELRPDRRADRRADQGRDAHHGYRDDLRRAGREAGYTIGYRTPTANGNPDSGQPQRDANPERRLSRGSSG